MSASAGTVVDAGRYQRAIVCFDAMNAADPNFETVESSREPKELLYARRMTDMLERFAPGASEAVRLAVRAQHVRRWEIPRTTYPNTPEGYKEWRTRLLDYHAEIGATVLRDCGYDEATIASVASLLRKERLKRNPDAQLLEDVAGLVFLEHYLEDFVARHPAFGETKLLDILRKTFRKMSARGVAMASTGIRLPRELAGFVDKAASVTATPSGPEPGPA